MGFEGAKSSLYYEILRIVREKRPPLVFWKRVSYSGDASRVAGGVDDVVSGG